MRRSVVTTIPNIPIKLVKKILSEHYHIQPTISPLPSERDQNFLVNTAVGKKYIFKIFNPNELKRFIDTQNSILHELVEKGIACPKIVKDTQGNELISIKGSDGSEFWARLSSFLKGVPLAEINSYSDSLLSEIGRFIGRLDSNLAQIDNPAVHRYFHWDISNGQMILSEYLHLIENIELQSILSQFLTEYEENAIPILKKLRRSVIHNDPNDYNLLVDEILNREGRNQRLTGILDFGDMVFSYTVSDLAIAIAYIILNVKNYLDAAAIVVRNYHHTYPLTTDEISILYYFICMRLCMSLCIAAIQVKNNPENSYLSISQALIIEKLPSILKIPPTFAEATFRAACDFNPNPKNIEVISHLKKQSRKIHPIFGKNFSAENSFDLDLSIGSPFLKFKKESNNQTKITIDPERTDFIRELPFWISQSFASKLPHDALNLNESPVSIINHPDSQVGMDIFSKSGGYIYSPLDGWIENIAHPDEDNRKLSYLVIAHRMDDDSKFFTIYHNVLIGPPGGLDNEKRLDIGDPVNKGDKIGKLAPYDALNLDRYYLRFQIASLLPKSSSKILTTLQHQIDEYISPLLIDPNLVLNIPDQVFLGKTTKKQLRIKRENMLGKNLSLSYQEPLKIDRGWMQYLYDETGRKYLDGYNNVPHVGHCHPEVIEAGFLQMGILNTNTRYLHDLIIKYAEELIETVPEPLKICYFVNSGSEANELALRMARAYTRQKDLLVLEGAYHGNTSTMIDISPYKHEGPGGMGSPDWVHRVPLPIPYRKPSKGKKDELEKINDFDIARIINSIHDKKRNLCGFIAETCPSVAGQIILPGGYLEDIYEHVHAVGGVCIADEVQTGYGRIGTHFYAFQKYKIIPDILVLGKPIGNGHPIGVVITTKEIADSFNNGMEFFSTFGGNPVSSAIGIKVLEIVKRERLQQHAFIVGDHLIRGLRELQTKHHIIGDVRGSGLFIGVELIQDRETLEPADTEASVIVNILRNRGILIGTDGLHNNVLKIRPPMPFNINDANFLLEQLEDILIDNYP